MDKCDIQEGSTPKCSKILALMELSASIGEFYNSFKEMKRCRRNTEKDLTSAIAETVNKTAMRMLRNTTNPLQVESPINTDFIDKDLIKAMADKVNSNFETQYANSFRNMYKQLDKTNTDLVGHTGFCEDCDLRIKCDLNNYEGV